MLNKIVVPLDGSPLAEEAIPAAAALARAAGATIDLVHVHEPPAVVSGEPGEIGAQSMEFMQRYLDAQRGRVRDALGVETRAIMLEGSVLRRLRRHMRATGTDLVVTMTHGRGGFSRFWLGSTAEALVRRSPAPVLILRKQDAGSTAADTNGQPFRHVLVPHDGSPAADRGLAGALAVGLPLHCRFTLLSVVGDEHDRITEKHRLDSLRCRFPEGATVTTVAAVAADTARTIVDVGATHAADLISMAPCARRSIGRLLSRTTADRVLRSSQVAVLIQPRERRRARDRAVPAAAVVPPPPSRVLSAIDFSTHSRTAAAWVARDLAPDAELVLTHVIDVPQPPVFLEGRFPSAGVVMDAALRGAEDQLRELDSVITAARKHIDLREGNLIEQLAGAAREHASQLIVLGQHTGRGHRDGTAERLLHVSPVPVLVAGHLPDGPPRRILVPVDGSANSMRALAWATMICRCTGALMTVMHAVDPTIAGHVKIVSSPRAAHDIEEDIVESARKWAGALALSVAQTPADQVIVTEGEPADEVLKAATESGADLIVMGSRGVGAVRRRLVGSVARAVLSRARCPVLVVVAHP